METDLNYMNNKSKNQSRLYTNDPIKILDKSSSELPWLIMLYCPILIFKESISQGKTTESSHLESPQTMTIEFLPLPLI